MSRARLLLITPEGDISAEFELKESNVVIGRSPQANLVIADSDVSRTHAQIVNTIQGFFVSDMGSTNGTYLNGVPIEPKQMFQLKSNDQVNLGRVSLLFQVVSDSLPSLEKNKATIRFQRAVSKVENTSIPLMIENSIPQPIYIPQAEHLNIEANHEELANEIFGPTRGKTKTTNSSAWKGWNLFQGKSQNNFSISDNWSEDEFVKEILETDIIETKPEKTNYPVLYKPKIKQIESEEKINRMPQLSYQATTQTIPSEEHAYVIDTESFYYPQAEQQDPKKFAPDAYSYDAETSLNTRDPFADLTFRDNDSFLSKFGNKYQSSTEKNTSIATKLDLKDIYQKFALPLGLIVGATIIAFANYFTNSGIFG